MRHYGFLFGAFCIVYSTFFALPAHAGSYANALGQCLIHSTTPADRQTAVRWAFATMALDPDVAPLASITSAQRASINRRAGALVTDLLSRACSQPVQRALMFEGPTAVQTAFEAWARWAIAGVASGPQVMQGTAALIQYIDIGKLMTLVPLQGFPPASSGRHP
ncbi:MAG: hypothetical protein ACREPU_06485 [Rhodanobacteraceae bacterium]